MMNKLCLCLILTFLCLNVEAVTLDFLVKKLYDENLELKVASNKINYGEAQVTGARSGHFPTLSFNNAATKGKDFESSASSVSNSSVAPSGLSSLTSGSSTSVGTSNSTTENEAWTSELSLSVPIFSRFAVSSSLKTAKNNLRQDQLNYKDLKSEKRSQLIRLILEINALSDIKETLDSAKNIISKVKGRAQSSRTRSLYNKSELLKLDTRYYELIYQKTRVEEGLELAHKAMYDLVPKFKEEWFDELPRIAIDYQVPDEREFENLYLNKSNDWKKDTLQIESTSEIYKATRWERPWVPLVVLSGSYGYSADFKTTPKDGDWRITLGVTFEFFDGFRSSARRGQALSSYLMTQHKREINKSKKLLMLKAESMNAKTSHAKYNFKMAIAKEKKHKVAQAKKLSRAGTTTSFEQSVLLLDYAMAKFEALDALKNYQSSILNIAKTLNEFEKVKINENVKKI